MNIGIRLHDVAGNTMEEKLQNAKAQGFTCVHLAMQKVIPGFKMQDAPKLLTPELAAEVSGLMKKYGMEVAVLGCYLNLGSPDEEQIAWSTETYKAHLRFAGMIGAKCVGTETGDPNTTYTYTPECETEESLQLFIKRLTPIVRYAEEVGQLMAIEPVRTHIVWNVDQAVKVVEAIPSPNLKIILDSVNLLLTDYVLPEDHTTEIIEDALDRLGDRIVVLHMKDYQREPGTFRAPSGACGTGVMDYKPLLTFAKQHPGLPMTLEDTFPENAEAARLHLEKVGAAL